MSLKIDSRPEYLVIDSRPILVAGLLGLMLVALVYSGLSMAAEGDVRDGLLLSVGGGAFLGVFIVIFVKRNQLVFDPGEGVIRHRRRGLLGYTEDVLPLDGLTGAEVEESRSSDGRTYRMVLQHSSGRHPFTTAYSSGSGARRASSAVNDWLASRKQAG